MALAAHFSKRLTLSYVLDWIVIIGIAAVGAGFYKVSPNHRPFSPVDPDLSFPYVENEKISTAVLAVVSIIAPAIITALIALLFTKTPHQSNGLRDIRTWRYKLWEWNTAWMGLGLGLAITFFFVEGLKNLIGKPRPDLLSRCNMDPAIVQQYAVGGEGGQLPLWNLLISSTACRQPDTKKLDDGFLSFPSGHTAFSWAGMSYLALYLCAKSSIRIPYLLPYSYQTNDLRKSPVSSSGNPSDGGISEHSKDDDVHSYYQATAPLHKQAVAPPAYLFILPLICISVSAYIASTRFSDFRHHGFDIIFGALMGILFSFVGFRMYHMPVRRGSGRSWAPRSVSSAWGVRVGANGYAESGDKSARRNDLEAGNGPMDAGLATSGRS